MTMKDLKDHLVNRWISVVMIVLSIWILILNFDDPKPLSCFASGLIFSYYFRRLLEVESE